MKLVASLRKDRPDIRLLIQYTGLVEATAADYADRCCSGFNRARGCWRSYWCIRR